MKELRSWLSIKNVAVALLFSSIILFSGFSVLHVINSKYERVLAYIEIVEIEGTVYVRTSYDTRIFPDECLPKQVVAYNYQKTCVDTVDTKTKKL